MKLLLLSLSATVMLSACGSTGIINAEKLNEPIPKERSRLVIERTNSFLYSGGATIIEIDGLEIARLGVGSSIVYDCQPGDKTLSVGTPFSAGKYKTTFKAVAGKQYDFEVSPRSGQLATTSLFGVVGDAATARASDKTGYFQINKKGEK